MTDSPLGNERRRVVMSAIREFVDGSDMETIGDSAYSGLMNTVEGQVRAVVSGENIPDTQRRLIVKSAVRDIADDVERADASDPAFADVMATVEGQVQRVLEAHGVSYE